jgi:hypothetical protein
MKYKITPTGSAQSIIVEAPSMQEVATKVKALGISAKIVKYVERPALKSIYTDRSMVDVTCGWGKEAHKWHTTKGDAMKHKNTCPQHRS